MLCNKGIFQWNAGILCIIFYANAPIVNIIQLWFELNYNMKTYHLTYLLLLHFANTLYWDLYSVEFTLWYYFSTSIETIKMQKANIPNLTKVVWDQNII